MKLIGSLTSPYVRKVRIVMAEKKLDFQLVLEDPWNGDVVIKSNPLGRVPCLVMEAGEAIPGLVGLREEHVGVEVEETCLGVDALSLIHI